jgi:hypothetical protein
MLLFKILRRMTSSKVLEFGCVEEEEEEEDGRSKRPVLSAHHH